MNLNIVVNGKSLQLDQHDQEPVTIASVLRHFDVQKRMVVVEQNGNIIDRSVYEKTPIQGGDQIEIVHFVGGG
ncbi:sulfur carrier protein ThiS [Brevibacillus daliensis]|uniref:sulfur carrier protein ThiS n=1 Tax=Brevibacillus daliensis TaxID=2892995 RepID=UPI001E54599A|nr:sulfur carrier protein ThiS [Brevibacillus daliensis]